MRFLTLVFLYLLPVCAQATMLADCDKASYHITVKNGGVLRDVLLTPGGGNIQEFGRMVSFQIKGQKPVEITDPDEEYCVWSGKITIQRRRTLNSESARGSSLR